MTGRESPKNVTSYIMDELVKQLEMRIKSLLQRSDLLLDTNLDLQRRTSLLQREKEALLAKNKVAISQIENMVSRLKSFEK